MRPNKARATTNIAQLKCVQQKQRDRNFAIHAVSRAAWSEPVVFSEGIHHKSNFPSMEVAFANLSAVRRLHRAIIVRIEFCKGRDLRGRSLNRSFHHEPSNTLFTGGNREGAIEDEIVLVGWQEIGGVDDHLLQLDFFSSFAGNVAPEVAQHGVFGAALDEYGNHSGAAGSSIDVHEVQLHVVFLAVNFILADMVKMVLHQRQRGSVDGDAAAGLVIDLNGVAVVDDFQRRKFVVEMDGSQLRGLRVDDINGRLALACLARGKIGRKVAPMVRAIRSAVTPVRSGRVFLGDRGMRTNERGAENKNCYCGAGETCGHGIPPWRRRKSSISLCGRIFKYSVWKIGNVRVYSQWPNGSEDENGRGDFRNSQA